MSKSSRVLFRKSFDYVERNYRYLVSDPRFFLMKYAARFEVVRTLSGNADPHADERLDETKSEALEPICELPRIVETLRDEGYFVGLTLRRELVDGMVRRANESVSYADRDRARPLAPRAAAVPATSGRAPRVASFLDQQEGWPEFQKLLHDPALQAIAHAYLGHPPLFLRSELCWSFPNPAATRDERLANAQVLHCDINDFRTLKFFFYLTDVGPESGPHSYQKKSPMPRSLRHQMLGQRCASIPEEELIASYPANDVVTVCGGAGTGFAGDPYYFHRGTNPTHGERLMLQLEFGINRFRTWYNGE